MPRFGHPARLIPAALIVLALGAGVDTIAAASDVPPPVLIVLVRHAERAEDGTRDPPISEAGQARARELASLLADVGIDHIHTTDYQRTRQTGAPTAAAEELAMQEYDGGDLTGFAAQLRATPGRHLVLGHSDTTPALVAALGGEPGAPIELMEYDRLYFVTVPARGPVSTVLLRFGARYAARQQGAAHAASSGAALLGRAP